jgi:carboxymethylenebutenolidase
MEDPMTIRTGHRTAALAIATLTWLAAMPAGYAQQVPEGGKSWVGHAPPGVRDPNLPPDESAAKEQLATSPRRSEWVEIKMASGSPIKTFVVHPQRDTKVGVAILLHEAAGLTEWLRATADQLARHGFIVLAPDLLSGKGPNSGGTESLGARAAEMTRTLTVDEVITRLNGVRDYATKLPTANGRVATVGVGWGGDMSFYYALKQPQLIAAVSFHGATPSDPSVYVNPKVPILGLYGGADKKRIDEDVPLAYVTLGDLFTPHVYLDATGTFLREQKTGGNLRATTWAWPEMISFLQRRVG